MAKTKINCKQCNKETYVENKEIKRGFGKFCSRQCSCLHRIQHLPELEKNVQCAYCKINFHKAENKTKHSKSGFYFCCREHKNLSQRIGGIVEIIPNYHGINQNNYREFVFQMYSKPKICERCGFKNHEAAIVVHHKDRNRENNTIENLEVLCANCHAIEHWGE